MLAVGCTSKHLCYQNINVLTGYKILIFFLPLVPTSQRIVNFNFKNQRMELMEAFAILNKVKESTNVTKFQ